MDLVPIARTAKELNRLCHKDKHIVALIGLYQAQVTLGVGIGMIVMCAYVATISRMIKSTVKVWVHEQEHAIPTVLTWQVIATLWATMYFYEHCRYVCKQIRRMNTLRERGKQFAMELIWAVQLTGCRTIRATINMIRGSHNENCAEWRNETDQDEIDRLLTERNRAHFGQSGNANLCQPPWEILMDFEGSCAKADMILQREFPEEGLTPATKWVLEQKILTHNRHPNVQSSPRLSFSPCSFW